MQGSRPAELCHRAGVCAHQSVPRQGQSHRTRLQRPKLQLPPGAEPHMSEPVQDKAVGPTERLAAPLWGHMGARGAGLPPYAASAALNGRIDGLGLARASAGGPIGPPMGAAAPSLARMSVGLYHTETAGGEHRSLMVSPNSDPTLHELTGQCSGFLCHLLQCLSDCCQFAQDTSNGPTSWCSVRYCKKTGSTCPVW